MTIRRLSENRRILVAAPACLDGQGRPATPKDLRRLTALRYGASDEPWRVIGPDWQTVEIAPRTRLRCDSGDVVHDWAVAGHGVMLRSEIDVADDLSLGRLERVLPGFASAPMPIHVLFTSKRQMSVKLRLFIEALMEHLQK